MAELRILAVCTANICRSPATATVLRRGLPTLATECDVVVESAGLAAVPGMPACDLSSALVGEFVARTYAVSTHAAPAGTTRPSSHPHTHRARRVTQEMVARADLVLALDRGHRTQLAGLVPAARQRTFTVREAARLARVVRRSLADGPLPPGLPDLPDGIRARFTWFVAALAAVRASESLPRARSGDRNAAAFAWDAEDVPDPHVLGYQIHPMAVSALEYGATTVCDAVGAVLAFAPGRTPGASV